MRVYDLSSPFDLINDLRKLLEKINANYEFSYNSNMLIVSSCIKDNSSTPWCSIENSEHFNNIVPEMKWLINSMYSFIEGYRTHMNDKYDYKDLEIKYQYFNEFRLLNNMIKHPKKKGCKISFTKVVDIKSKYYELICIFKFNSASSYVPFSRFVAIFLHFLLDNKLIKLK